MTSGKVQAGLLVVLFLLCYFLAQSLYVFFVGSRIHSIERRFDEAAAACLKDGESIAGPFDPFWCSEENRSDVPPALLKRFERGLASQFMPSNRTHIYKSFWVVGGSAGRWLSCISRKGRRAVTVLESGNGSVPVFGTMQAGR